MTYHAYVENDTCAYASIDCAIYSTTNNRSTACLQDALRRLSVEPAPRLSAASDPAVPLDPSRLRTVTESEESGCDNGGYEDTRRTSQL